MNKLNRSHDQAGAGGPSARSDVAALPGRTTLTAALGTSPQLLPQTVGRVSGVQAAEARGMAAPPGALPHLDLRGPAGPAEIEAMFDAAASGPTTELPFRREMERSFGRDLSGVKVVLGRPAELKAMGAAAAARGDTIVFATGSPSKLEVAHELTHYVQNTSGAGPSGSLSQPGDAAEQEADSVAHRAAAGEQVAVHASPTGSIQRMLVGWELETIVPIYENGQRADHVDGYARQSTEYAHQNVDAALSGQLGAGFDIHVDSTSLAPRSALNRLNPNAKLHIAEVVAQPVQTRAALLERMIAVKNFLSFFAGNRELTGSKFSMGWPTPQGDWEAAAPVGNPVRIPQNELEQLFARDASAASGKLHDVSTQLTFQGPPESLKTISDLDKQSVSIPDPKAGPQKRGERVRMIKVDRNVVDRAKMSEALGIPLEGDLSTRAMDVAVKIFKDAIFFLTRPFTGTVKNSVAFLIRSDLGQVFADLDSQERNSFADSVKAAIGSLTPEDLKLQPSLKKEYFDKGLQNIKLHRNVYNLIVHAPEREAGELEHLDESLQGAVSQNAGEDMNLPWTTFAAWFAAQVHDAVRDGANGAVTGPLHGSQNLGILPEEGDAQGAAQPRVVFENRKPLQVRIDGDALPAEIVEELDLVGFPH
ncbi:MAG TPA: DUF4157 domain-containing protein [Kofleriaceae bacterium]|nr:DUF4157 domain-containing protein [Kofleriaceae bacterium]